MDLIVENPRLVDSAEIVVGIPSLNEADNIAYPTDVASRGLVEFFPNKKAVIINADNHSTDGTKDAFLKTPTKVPKVYISTPPGVVGKGINVRNILRASIELGAVTNMMVPLPIILLILCCGLCLVYVCANLMEEILVFQEN